MVETVELMLVDVTIVETPEDFIVELAVDPIVEILVDNIVELANVECKGFVVVLIVETSVLVSMNLKNVFLCKLVLRRMSVSFMCLFNNFS